MNSAFQSSREYTSRNRASGGITLLARTEARLAALRHDLGIDASQEVRWESLAACMRARAWQQAETWHGDPQTANAPPTAMDALDNAVVELQQRGVELAAMRGSTRALYEVLSPRQRRKADRLLPRFYFNGI